MGAVWLATQLMVDRPVAIKLLHPAHSDEADLLARFEVEAKAIGKLNHPNVITLYDFGWSAKLSAFYTVIEYIDGVSLDKRLNDQMPFAEVADITRQIALALDHAHYHGILHRDLKPENVMLARMTDGSQIVKVLDFGIARIVKGSYDRESPDSQRITKAGEVFGTPAYMSPEQARSLRRLTPAADLYSLGVMMYELVAGHLPFFAKSAFDLLMLHVTKPVPPITRTDVPPQLLDVVFRLLEKDPERRFQSGGELARTLAAMHLPEEAPISEDDFDGYPTYVDANVPTFEREALATALATATTPQDGAPVALPTPARPQPTQGGYSSPYIGTSQSLQPPPQPMHPSQPLQQSGASMPQIRANTVMMNGAETTAEAQAAEAASTRATLMIVGVVFLLLVALVAAVGLMPERTAAGPDHENLKKAIGASNAPKPKPQPVVLPEPAEPPAAQLEAADAGSEHDAETD